MITSTDPKARRPAVAQSITVLIFRSSDTDMSTALCAKEAHPAGLVIIAVADR